MNDKFYNQPPIKNMGTNLGEERWFVWRERVQSEDSVESRFIIPRSDPRFYEHRLDAIFTSIEQAIEYLIDNNVTKEEAKNLVLCMEELFMYHTQPDFSTLKDD